MTLPTKLPDGISRVTDPGGREALRLESAAGVALVSLLGAQVLSWHHRGRDALWTASDALYQAGKPVRGGIPIVFPWFGDHRSDPAMPAHGFARNELWQLKAARSGPAITLELTDNVATQEVWPHTFALQLEIAVSDDLRIAMTIENRGEHAFECEEALHTYFAVGDVHTAAVRGLEGVPFVEHAAAPEADWDVNAPIRFRAETDRVFQQVPQRLDLDCPALDRTVTLATERAQSTIVWNPWPAKTARLSQMAADDWQRFVCVESANVHADSLQIGPGAAHTMVLRLSCGDLAV